MMIRSVCTRGLSLVLLLVATASAADGPRIATAPVATIERHGVTYHFSSRADRLVPATVQAGRYVSGDWFVLATPNRWLVRMDPESTRGPALRGGGQVWLHGAQINPGAARNGFDERIEGGSIGYDHPLNTDPGATGRAIPLDRPMSVVKAISRSNEQRAGHSGFSWIDRYDVLTVVDGAPPAGAFRPPVIGEDKTSRFTESMIDYGRLQNLPPVGGMPSLEQAAAAAAPLMQAWITAYAAGGDQSRRLHAVQHYSGYGRDMARQLAGAMLATHRDAPREEKRNAVVNLVQVGLDLIAQVQAGRGFGIGGAITQGRKPVAVYAATLLNDPELLAAVHAETSPASWGNADRQYYRITENLVGRVIGGPAAPNRIAHTPYDEAHLGFAEWRENASRITASLSSNYRHLATESTYRSLLPIHLTRGAVEAWGSTLPFEYMDRAHRWYMGHYANQWSMASGGASHWSGTQHGHLAARQQVELFESYRGLSSMPVWEGNPEQMWPPRVAAVEGARAVTVTLDAFQCLNGGDLVRRDLRYRMVGGERWNVMEGVDDVQRVEGLSGAAEFEFQTRVVSTLGAGGWSTNLPRVAGQPAQARAATAELASPPVNWTVPVLAPGAVRVGQPLHVHATGQWSGYPDAALSLQWQRDADGWHDIPGATAEAYTPVPRDAGYALRAVVAAANASGRTTAATAATRPVDGADARPTARVVFEGTHLTPIGQSERLFAFGFGESRDAVSEDGAYLAIVAGTAEAQTRTQFATPMEFGVYGGASPGRFRTLAEQRITPGSRPTVLLTGVGYAATGSLLRFQDGRPPFTRVMLGGVLLRCTGLAVDRAVGATGNRLEDVPAGSLVVASVLTPWSGRPIAAAWTGPVQPVGSIPFGQPRGGAPGFMEHGRLLVAMGFTQEAGDVVVEVDLGDGAGERLMNLVAIPPF